MNNKRKTILRVLAFVLLSPILIPVLAVTLAPVLIFLTAIAIPALLFGLVEFVFTGEFYA